MIIAFGNSVSLLELKVWVGSRTKGPKTTVDNGADNNNGNIIINPPFCLFKISIDRRWLNAKNFRRQNPERFSIGFGIRQNLNIQFVVASIIQMTKRLSFLSSPRLSSRANKRHWIERWSELEINRKLKWNGEIRRSGTSFFAHFRTAAKVSHSYKGGSVEKSEATNVMIFKYIHWRPGISNSFLHPPTHFQFSAFSRDLRFIRVGGAECRYGWSAPLTFGGGGRRKQHEIQIKSFQKPPLPLSMAQQVFDDGVCVFLKWLMGMKSSFSSFPIGVRWHLCSYTHVFIFIDEHAKTWAFSVSAYQKH